MVVVVVMTSSTVAWVPTTISFGASTEWRNLSSIWVGEGADTITSPAGGRNTIVGGTGNAAIDSTDGSDLHQLLTADAAGDYYLSVTVVMIRSFGSCSNCAGCWLRQLQRGTIGCLRS